MKKSTLLLILVFLIFTGCSEKELVVIDDTFQIPKAQQVVKKESFEKPTLRDELKTDKDATERKKIVHCAMKYLNKKNGRDCSGFVELINTQNAQPYYASSKLNHYYSNSRRSKAIYNIMKKNNKVVNGAEPKVADLVFFEDTLKQNRRKIGSLNITHVGIITQVDKDGTVHFIHNMNGKNRVDKLNMKFAGLEKKSGKVVNSYLKRCKSKRTKKECLASYFFSAYATL